MITNGLCSNMQSAQKLGTTSGTGPSPSHEKQVQEEYLKRQADKIANRKQDSVEISTTARQLSESARALSQASQPTEKKQPTTASHIAATMDTREGRAELAKDYNAILDSYRSEYGEKEGMRKFDEFMASEGFERVEGNLGGLYADGIRGSTSLDPRDRLYGSVYTNDLMGAFTGIEDNFSSNLHTRSGIKTVEVNGDTKYNAATYAIFAADYSGEVHDAVEQVYNRNLDALQSETNIDLDGILREMNPTGQVSAASINKDLAAITNTILKEAGLELEAGQWLSLRLDESEAGKSLRVVGNVDTDLFQKAIDDATQKDPSIIRRFENELSSVDALDVGSLNGQFTDGNRSVEFTDMGRGFLLSGDSPDTMIMTDTLGIQSTGYTYQKKVSDTFDPYADTKSVLVPAGDPRNPSKNYTSVTENLRAEIQNSLATGENIASTMSDMDDEAVPQLMTPSPGRSTTLGSGEGITEEEMKVQLYAEEARLTAHYGKDRFSQELDYEVSYYDEKHEVQKALVQDFIGRLF